MYVPGYIYGVLGLNYMRTHAREQRKEQREQPGRRAAAGRGGRPWLLLPSKNPRFGSDIMRI